MFVQRLSAVGVVAVALLSAGCGAAGLSTGIPALDENLDAMPFITTGAKDVISPDAGPDGSIFGLLMEDDTQAYVLGSNDAAGNPMITGVVFADEFGRLIFQQDVREDGMTLTSANGDAIDLAFGDTQRVTLTLNGSDPPSVVVVDIDAFGNATVDDSATTMVETLNAAYEGGAGSISVSSPSAFLKTIDPGPRAQSIADPVFFTCLALSNTIEDTLQFACQAKTVFTTKLPEATINALCLAADQGFALAANQTNSDGKRVFSALRLGLGSTCKLMKVASGLVGTVAKVNPLGVACFGLRAVSNSKKALSGQSLADAACDLVTSPPDLTADDSDTESSTVVDTGGNDTVTQSCVSDGVCESACPAGTTDPDCVSASDDCRSISEAIQEATDRWFADQSDSNWCAVLQLSLDAVNTGCGTGTTAEDIRAGGEANGCTLSG